jgi:hypothetical protein
MTNFFDGVAGDLTGDGMLTAADIDLLSAMINRGTAVKTYDLDGSGTVDSADRVFLVENIMGTFMGDANLDGHVNVADLNVVGLHWQQTGDCLMWSNGNFDGNERVDAADLNVVGINWLAAIAQARVPRAPLATRVALVDASLADLGSETVVSRRTYIQSSSSIAQSSNVAQGSNIAQGSNERAGVGMRPSRWEQVMRRRFSGIV